MNKVTERQIIEWFKNNYPYSIRFTKEEVKQLLEILESISKYEKPK